MGILLIPLLLRCCEVIMQKTWTQCQVHRKGLVDIIIYKALGTHNGFIFPVMTYMPYGKREFLIHIGIRYTKTQNGTCEVILNHKTCFLALWRVGHIYLSNIIKVISTYFFEILNAGQALCSVIMWVSHWILTLALKMDSMLPPFYR